MAETWCRAFGRYLRTLRQRRGLSLQEVCSLSQAFAERLEKGYLSRCENGYQGPAFSKIIPLSRIYDVPADVLLERLELDMELDRVGSPPTDGMTFAELTHLAYTAYNEGYGWNAYAFARDAVNRAAVDPVLARYRDFEEQKMCAHMNCATAARLLGRNLFALYEYRYVEGTGALGPTFHPIVLERLSRSYRSLDQLDLALEYGNRAIDEAKRSGESSGLGYLYSNRAQLAFEAKELQLAADYYCKAYDAFRKVGRRYECARSLNNLAQTYFDLGRLRAARRALLAAEGLTQSLRQRRAQALTRILLGEIESLEHKNELAARRWREAAAIAKTLDDKVLRFKAEFFLYKQAHELGNQPVARSLHRRLRKLAQWIPDDTPELTTFEQLASHEVATSPN